GASDEVADAMYEFGRLVGISFQIQDDVIDMVTPEDILGKVRGSDLIEGKRTLIAIHALNHGVELEIFGKGGSVSPEQIDEAVSILEGSGSIKYAQDLSTETLERGKKMLDVLGDSEAKNILLAVADYMVTRNY
ncbi:MAG: polyprenyl synthetase family protein, partial [Methanococcoides sp.]|nr:polyprenyl synthetase family protein [Methanococcoides sp.]